MNYYDVALARGLAANGIEARLYTSDDTDETGESGFSVVKPFRALYNQDHKLRRALRFLRGVLWSVRDAKTQGIRVIHLHYFQFGVRELISCLAVKAYGIRVVATVHDVTTFSASARLSLVKSILRLTDQVIVHNSYSAAQLEAKMTPAGNAPPISVIRHGNYCDSVIPIDVEEARQRLELKSDQPVLLFFGQVKPHKGLDLLLKAFARFKHAGHPGVLLVAGRAGKDESMYRQLINSYEIEASVRLDFRYIPDVDAQLYYSACDLVVLPYREIYQSGVLLMAMSYGRATLCSDIPGMNDLVRDGDTGVTFTVNDDSSLFEALVNALHNTEGLHEMGGRARALVDTEYNWIGIGAKTKTVYERAVVGC
ncbi:MAG: glycosyltransferase family 4 protein [Pseudomonadota bacterium]